jgi:hypothetical protein
LKSPITSFAVIFFPSACYETGANFTAAFFSRIAQNWTRHGKDRRPERPSYEKDFVRFWRIPEGDCELLSARYTTQSFGRHSHDRYAVGVISAGVEKLFYRGSYALGGVAALLPSRLARYTTACLDTTMAGCTACSGSRLG